VKKQLKTIVLLVAVVAIWGVISYRVADAVNPEEEPLEPIVIKTRSSVSKSAEEYRLRLSYRDPFLSNPSAEINQQDQSNNDIHPRTTPAQNKMILPKLNFMGVVNSEDNFIGILRINNLPKMVKVGDELEGFRVVDLKENEINLLFVTKDTLVSLNASVNIN